MSKPSRVNAPRKIDPGLLHYESLVHMLLAAVESHPVQNPSHPVFSHPESEVAPIATVSAGCEPDCWSCLNYA